MIFEVSFFVGGIFDLYFIRNGIYNDVVINGLIVIVDDFYVDIECGNFDVLYFYEIFGCDIDVCVSVWGCCCI